MNDSYLLALVILLLCYLKFLVYLIFCDNILVVDLVTLVVDMFVDVVAALVATGLAGVIVMSSIINIITNFSYRRDIRSSRSSSDSPFTPP